MRTHLQHLLRPQLRLSRKISTDHLKLIAEICAGLPPIIGSPVFISSGPQLTAYRGQLLSGTPQKGKAVHGASFIRERRIVLESELFCDKPRFRLILAHELFHFIWPRLGNAARHGVAELLKQECRQHARGELGESASAKKGSLTGSPHSWKDYVCESFCDTGAWLYSGVTEHETFTLSRRWRERRAQYFRNIFGRYTGAWDRL